MEKHVEAHFCLWRFNESFDSQRGPVDRESVWQSQAFSGHAQALLTHRGAASKLQENAKFEEHNGPDTSCDEIKRCKSNGHADSPGDQPTCQDSNANWADINYQSLGFPCFLQANIVFAAATSRYASPLEITRQSSKWPEHDTDEIAGREDGFLTQWEYALAS